MRELFLGLLIVLFPISHMEMMPQQILGISGNNPVNLIWLLSLVAVITQKNSRKTVGDKAPANYASYFSASLCLFVGAYLIAALWSAIDVDNIHPPLGQTKLTTGSIFISYFFKPMQIVVTGWMIYKYCKLNDTKYVQLAIKLIPLVMLPFIAYYYYKGATAEGGYFSSREFLSVKMGLNANEAGGLGILVLGYSLGLSKGKFKFVDYISIGASLLVVVFSLSRMAFVATAILSVLSFRTLSAAQRFLFVILMGSIVVGFSSMLLSRIEFGTETKKGAVDANALSAGRIDHIWIPSLEMISDHPIFGQGVLSIWKGSHKNTVSNQLALPAHPHSAYLQVLLDMGVFGEIILAYMLLAMWKLARSKLYFKYTLLCWGLMGLTGSTFYPDIFTLPVWLVYALAAAND